jgi:hypothetical protein
MNTQNRVNPDIVETLLAEDLKGVCTTHEITQYEYEQLKATPLHDIIRQLRMLDKS